MAQPQAGETVKVHYTGKLENGEVFDSSKEGEPLEFTIGSGNIIPGFEAAVSEMEAGESKTITIPAEKAYGPRSEKVIFNVERSKLPQEMEPQVGMQLAVSSDNGQQVPVWITDVKPESVTLDGNHPLAGKDLTFELELVAIG